MLKAQLQWLPRWKFPAFIDAALQRINLFSEEIMNEIPCVIASPRLNMYAQDIENLYFKSVKLVQGWTAKPKKKNDDRIEWEAREVKDCRKDLKGIADNVFQQLEKRFEDSFPRINNILHKCLDFGLLLQQIKGSRHKDKEYPVNKIAFTKFGSKEFEQVVDFVSRLPHVKELNHPFCKENSGSVFWKVKKKLISMIWGDSFKKNFPIFFNLVNGEQENLKLKDTNFIKSFKPRDSSEFTLTGSFYVTLDDNSNIEVVFHEEKVIKSLYTNPKFYTNIGQEFCIIYDIMYAKTGTKSVVESFYGFICNQEMDGGQLLEVLANRAKIDWCFLNILNCERALDTMALKYVNGDSSIGIKRHHVSVYKNKKSLHQKKFESVKVHERLKKRFNLSKVVLIINKR